MLSGHQGIKVAGNIWYGECPKKKGCSHKNCGGLTLIKNMLSNNLLP